jgi:membrane protein involved in colicin uptake
MQDNSNYTKNDVLKSILIHSILLISVIFCNYWQDKKVFLDLKPINNQANISETPIKASLVDHKEVQLAIKRQEKAFIDRVAKEKKLEQQEQKIAKLASLAEQEANKLKQEKESLKKEQENLQKLISKIAQQKQELAAQQNKLSQMKQQEAIKKKNLNNINSGINTSTNNSISDGSEIQSYHNKMYTKIINNRKVTSLFPEHLECSVRVKLLPNGQLNLVKLDKSSGNQAYDAFSEQAIYKSAPFEMPEDPKLNKELVEIEHVFIFTASLVNNI